MAVVVASISPSVGALACMAVGGWGVYAECESRHGKSFCCRSFVELCLSILFIVGSWEDRLCIGCEAMFVLLAKIYDTPTHAYIEHRHRWGRRGKEIFSLFFGIIL